MKLASHEHPGIHLRALAALLNFCSDQQVAEKILDLGGIGIVLDHLKKSNEGILKSKDSYFSSNNSILYWYS